MKKLSELSSGSTGKIAAINGDTHFQSRVTSIGLTTVSYTHLTLPTTGS